MTTPAIAPIPPNDAFTNSVSGLQRAEQSADKAANGIVTGNGDTAGNILALNQASNDFAANAAVLNTISDVTKRLVDIFA